MTGRHLEPRPTEPHVRPTERPMPGRGTGCAPTNQMDNSATAGLIVRRSRPAMRASAGTRAPAPPVAEVGVMSGPRWSLDPELWTPPWQPRRSSQPHPSPPSTTDATFRTGRRRTSAHAWHCKHRTVTRQRLRGSVSSQLDDRLILDRASRDVDADRRQSRPHEHLASPTSQVDRRPTEQPRSDRRSFPTALPRHRSGRGWSGSG